MATISGQGAARSPAVEDLVSSVGRGDLRTCRPKRNGRSFVWTEELFLFNKQGGAVCVVCTSVVATTCGNTSNLIAPLSKSSQVVVRAVQKCEVFVLKVILLVAGVQEF